jgi:hypothetical protein
MTIEQAFAKYLGSAPKRASICIVLDDAVPRLDDRQVADSSTSYYLIERRDWPAIKIALEAAIGASTSEWCRVVNFDPTGSYGDMFTRIADAASESLRKRARF